MNAGLNGFPRGAPRTAYGFLSALVGSEIPISTATNLTDTAFGKMYVCSGATANYSITLPTVTNNAGKIIGFRMDSALTKLVTLVGTIDGQANRILWAQEVAILLCDGTSWVKIAGKSRPMLCRIRANSSQSIPSNSVTQITLGSVDYDLGNLANTANSRILISRPGKMRVSGRVSTNEFTSASPRTLGKIMKNGANDENAEQYCGVNSFGNIKPSRIYDVIAGDSFTLHAYFNVSNTTFVISEPFCDLIVEELVGW